MTARFCQTGAAVGLIMTAVACGGGGSTPAPTPVAVKSAVVTVTMIIESAKVGTSNHYTAHVTVRESGGLGVTLGNATFTFFVGTAAYATVDVTGGEAWVNITLPASTSLVIEPDHGDRRRSDASPGHGPDRPLVRRLQPEGRHGDSDRVGAGAEVEERPSPRAQKRGYADTIGSCRTGPSGTVHAVTATEITVTDFGSSLSDSFPS